jgi:undecaprenyl-diphosphatase
VTYWQAVLLGLVQGLTEFLPVSSSGHLVLVERLVGVHTPGVAVEVALHVATLGSVLAVYGRRLVGIAGGVVKRRPADLRYAGLLVLATIPAGLVGVLLGDVVERAFDSLWAVGAAFLVTAALLWSTRRTTPAMDVPSTTGALAIGVAQAIAILPGISRSGATVTAGMWARLGPVRAAEFSFLMAIPVIAGAGLLEARHLAAGTTGVGAGPLLLACAVAFASGIWAIRLLVALLRRGRFSAFAPYCLAVGLVTLALAAWR